MVNYKISDPACMRLCKRSGIKSVSKKSHKYIKDIIDTKIDEILGVANIIINQNNSKTILDSHIYEVISLIQDGTYLGKYKT